MPDSSTSCGALSAANITLLAVENDPMQARILRHELRALGYELAGIARTADEAETLFDTLEPDLVLLDVRLDGPRDGIETAAALVARRRVPLIFITSSPDGQTFARARLVGPFAFLGKPYNGPLLGHSIELALQHFASDQGLPAADGTGELAEGTVLLGGIFVREQHRFVKLPLAQVLLLEADGSHTHLRTATRKFTLRLNLGKLLERLPAKLFCQVHRGFVVQLAAVDALDSRTGTLRLGEHTVPVGRSYRDALTARLRPLSSGYN
ncbi:LytR/AlgR family response regulator transcription factor [Hymenobacter sp. IS2118]|uniref:LytR/AlgR family response regulator transcription factor n=1 Tax=Hymenobacter sp. IS2118 TaxID=1505605 RepID=UPI00068D9F2C|nr:response regulator transcription factor [Hymenobacter sp. IS2118]